HPLSFHRCNAVVRKVEQNKDKNHGLEWQWSARWVRRRTDSRAFLRVVPSIPIHAARFGSLLCESEYRCIPKPAAARRSSIDQGGHHSTFLNASQQSRHNRQFF